MLRCTIEMVPKGNEELAYPLGLIEIALQEVDEKNQGAYKVVLKKCVPFKGALKHAWKTGTMLVGHEDEEIIVGGVVGHHRTKRGAYDLLYRALVACGIRERNQ